MNEQDYFQQMNQAPPLALPSEKADLLDKIQPEAIVKNIFHRLRGEIESNGTWIPEPSLQERSLSLRGAWDICTLMLPVSSQNVSLSKLKDAEIKARTLSIVKTNQFNCLRNWREYGIKGTDSLRLTHEVVMSNSFITMKQPEGEGIRNLLKNIASADFSPNEPEKEGFANFFRK